jgi:hypothetical protein
LKGPPSRDFFVFDGVMREIHHVFQPNIPLSGIAFLIEVARTVPFLVAFSDNDVVAAGGKFWIDMAATRQRKTGDGAKPADFR